MSNYTTQVRWICESKSGFTPEQLMNKTVDEVIEASRSNVFNFTYPIYDQAYKPVLESLILNHFYVREIGQETVGLWQLFLKNRLREIMPYYNKLYESALIEYNPLYDVDVTRTHEGNNAGTSSNEAHRTGSTSGHGTTAEQTSGTSGNTRNETRDTDTTVTDNKTTTGTGTKDSTVTTNTETDTTTSATGSKNTTSEYEDHATERNAYSATPESTVQGVEGDGSGSGNVSDNYWLTDYRKITTSKSGEASGTEHTTNNETGHSESEGSQVTDEDTTSRVVESGTTVTNEEMTGTITDAGTTSGTLAGETTSTGSSSDDSTGSAQFANTDAYVEHVVGKQGAASYASMILEYRETLINIDAMVLNELEDLFMQIY